MQRTLFTITPLYNGWQVRDELRNRDWFVALDDAVVAANTLAYALHSLTGKPTGVMVDDGKGGRTACGQHD